MILSDLSPQLPEHVHHILVHHILIQPRLLQRRRNNVRDFDRYKPLRVCPLRVCSGALPPFVEMTVAHRGPRSVDFKLHLALDAGPLLFGVVDIHVAPPALLPVADS